MNVSGHACYTFSQRTLCPLEEAPERICNLLEDARRVPVNSFRSEDYLDGHRKKALHAKREYLRNGEYIFVINATGDTVVTVLVDDPISQALYKSENS